MYQKLVTSNLKFNNFIGKVVFAVIVLLLSLCPALIAATDSQENNDKAIERDTSNFKKCWNKNLAILGNMFGTTNLTVSEKDIGNLGEFEKFISSHAVNNHVRLIQKKVTIKDLISLPKPLVLLQTDKNGFVVLLETFIVDSNRVYQILNAEKKPIIMTEEELQKQWSGTTYYVDRSKEEKVLYRSGEFALELSGTAYNFGLVSPVKQQGSIKIKNIGDQPIQIKKTKSSCSCTVVSPSEDATLQPLQEMNLSFTVSLKEGYKGFRHSIVIPVENLTNKVSQMLKVEVMGNCDEIETTQDKLSNIEDELQSLRSDMKKIVSDLKNIQTAQPKPSNKKQVDTTIYDIEIGASPVKGLQTAPVTIVEFVDFQCPYCIREWSTLKQILEEYPNKVKLVLKHFPLNFHTKAKPVHIAAEFVHRKAGDNVFWKMYDMIISNPKELDVNTMRKYIELLGLVPTDFDALLSDPVKADELLQTDISEARKCNVNSTPTVLINGLKLTSRGINDYKTRIEQILSDINNK